MTRIACILAAAAALCVPPCGMAAPHTTSHARSSPARPAPVVVRPVVVGYAPSYAYRSTTPVSPTRAAAPLSYIPPASPDAPPFSMSGSPAVEGWHRQRVSLQQIDAEVRAKRAAAARPAGARPD